MTQSDRLDRLEGHEDKVLERKGYAWFVETILLPYIFPVILMVILAWVTSINAQLMQLKVELSSHEAGQTAQESSLATTLSDLKSGQRDLSGKIDTVIYSLNVK